MNPVSIELNGAWPRSEALVAATRDHDRKRISAGRLADVLRRQREEVIAFQNKVGVVTMSDGQLNWQDWFRPFATFCSGIEPGTLTRYADTNTFFRQPVVQSTLSFTGREMEQFFGGLGQTGKWKVTLPAPFFFARVADNRRYPHVSALADAFAGILIKLIAVLRESAYVSFELFDPYLGYLGASTEELCIVKRTTDAITSSTRADIEYYVGFSCSRSIVNALLQTKVSAIGIDFFNTDISTIPSFKGRRSLVAGCVDSRTSLVEHPKAVADFLRSAARLIEPQAIRATSTIDLQFVPVSIAEKKLDTVRQAIVLIDKR